MALYRSVISDPYHFVSDITLLSKVVLKSITILAKPYITIDLVNKDNNYLIRQSGHKKIDNAIDIVG